MYPFALPLALPSGLVESFGDVVVGVGMLVLLLMLVALGAYAYKHLRGDGIEWPEDREAQDGEPGRGSSPDDELQRGSGDDEWDYY